MTLNDLREQLQENIRTYLDEYDMYIVDDLCDIVVNTFDEAFFAHPPSTLNAQIQQGD